MAGEVAVKLKDKNKSLTKKFSFYGPFKADFDDERVQGYINETRKDFGEAPPLKIDVTIKLIDIDEGI